MAASTPAGDRVKIAATSLRVRGKRWTWLGNLHTVRKEILGTSRQSQDDRLRSCAFPAPRDVSTPARALLKKPYGTNAAPPRAEPVA